MPHQTWRRRARNREGTGVARRHVGGRLGARPMLFVGRDMRGERRVGPSIQGSPLRSHRLSSIARWKCRGKLPFCKLGFASHACKQIAAPHSKPRRARCRDANSTPIPLGRCREPALAGCRRVRTALAWASVTASRPPAAVRFRLMHRHRARLAPDVLRRMYGRIQELFATLDPSCQTPTPQKAVRCDCAHAPAWPLPLPTPTP